MSFPRGEEWLISHISGNWRTVAQYPYRMWLGSRSTHQHLMNTTMYCSNSILVNMLHGDYISQDYASRPMYVLQNNPIIIKHHPVRRVLAGIFRSSISRSISLNETGFVRNTLMPAVYALAICSLDPRPVSAMIVAGCVVPRFRSIDRIAWVASKPSITGILMSIKRISKI